MLDDWIVEIKKHLDELDAYLAPNISNIEGLSVAAQYAKLYYAYSMSISELLNTVDQSMYADTIQNFNLLLVKLNNLFAKYNLNEWEIVE
jgi:hypothetical protein